MYSKEMCSAHNEGKSVVAEWFVRTLKNKYKSIYKSMTSILKMVYNNELEEIVNKHKNTYEGTSWSIRYYFLHCNGFIYIIKCLANTYKGVQLSVKLQILSKKTKNKFLYVHFLTALTKNSGEQLSRVCCVLWIRIKETLS